MYVKREREWRVYYESAVLDIVGWKIIERRVNCPRGIASGREHEVLLDRRWGLCVFEARSRRAGGDY